MRIGIAVEELIDSFDLANEKVNMKTSAKNVVDQLRSDGDAVFIVVPKSYQNSERATMIIEKLLKDGLKTAGIEYDGMEFYSFPGFRKDMCNEFGINALVENGQVEYLITNDKKTDIKNSIEINNFEEVYEILKDIKKSRKPSEERPWPKYYPDRAFDFRVPEMTIYNFLYEQNKDHLNMIAITYDDSEITYSELFEHVDRIAKSFVSNGIKAGDIVTMCLPTIPEASYTVLALNKIGAIVNPISSKYSPNQIRDSINEAESKWVIMYDDTYYKYKEIESEVPTVESMVLVNLNETSMPYKNEFKNNHIYETDEKCMPWRSFYEAGKNLESVAIATDPDSIAILAHTSGSLASTKTAMLSNRNLVFSMSSFEASAEFRREQVLLDLLQIDAIFGLLNNYLLPLCLGMNTVLVPSHTVKDIVMLMQKYRPNLTKCAPIYADNFVATEGVDEMDWSFVDIFLGGGDSTQEKTELSVNRILEDGGSKYKYQKGYAQTETCASLFYTYNNCNKLGSAGIPIPGIDIKIVNPETREEVGYNEPGELLVKGGSIFQGYYKNPELNAEAFTEDGWYKTGDILSMDEDGCIYFKDRMKEIYIRDGEKVYSKVVEAIISSHPLVFRAALIGYNIDGKCVLVLQIMPKITDGIDEVVFRNEILELCRKNLSQAAIPEEIVFGPLRFNLRNGKVDKEQLKIDNAHLISKYKEPQFQQKADEKIRKLGTITATA